MRSRLFLVTLVTDAPALTWPEYMRRNTNLPTKGSVTTFAILKGPRRVVSLLLEQEPLEPKLLGQVLKLKQRGAALI